MNVSSNQTEQFGRFCTFLRTKTDICELLLTLAVSYHLLLCHTSYHPRLRPHQLPPKASPHQLPPIVSLHQLPPMVKATSVTTHGKSTSVTTHDLRPRAHNFILPLKDNSNFIPRVLFRF